MMGTAMDKEDGMLEAVRDYTRRGWRVVPVRRGGKGVMLAHWTDLRLDEDDLPRWFRGAAAHNIGVLLGEPSGGLVDIDCDAPEAREAAKELLPATGLVSGRASAPASHYWYRIEGALPATAKFADVGAAALSPYPPPLKGRGDQTAAPGIHAPGNRGSGSGSASGSGSPPSSGEGLGERAAHHTTMLIELRSTGCQTVAPPSLHPRGEVVRWERGAVSEPGVATALELRAAVARVAAVALLARHWPGEGQRDEAAKDLAGLLLRGGWSEEAVDDFIRLVARIAGDEEWRRRAKARHTASKLAEGTRVTGGTSLAGRLTSDGERVVAQVRAWLGMSGLGSAHLPRSTEGAHGDSEGRRSDEMIVFADVDRLRTVIARDVKKERVHWLWRGRIPLGAITLLDGDPGLGKSLLSLDLAARVTTGRAMPFAEALEGGPAGVVVLSEEDDLAATICPRLEMAAADMNRIEIVCGVNEIDPGTGRVLGRSFRLPLDLPDLERSIRRMEARLVVIDPLMAYLEHSVNSWNDQHVRSALAPLAALAERTGAAILILRHLNKASGMSAIQRGGGSIGIIGAARSGLLVAKAPDDPEHERVLAATKSNLGPPMPSLRYQIIAPLKDNEGLDADGVDYLRDVPVVEWLGESPLSATALLAATESGAVGGNTTKRAQAGLWLRDALAAGPRPVTDVELEAVAEGISLGTLTRASKDIGVVKEKVGFSDDTWWTWRLPTKREQETARGETENPPKTSNVGEDDHPQRVTAFGADAHLHENATVCPVTGGPHEYAIMRDAQGRLLCFACEQPRP